MKDAPLSRQEKSTAPVGTKKSLKYMDLAEAMRRLFGSCDGVARQDFLIADDAFGPLDRDKGQKVCATRKKAKKQEVGKKRTDVSSKPSRGKLKGGAQF